MKASLLFVLIYTAIVETEVFCETAEGNSTRADLTSNCDLREDEERDKVLLSRKRRFLTFPEGSAFASTLSLVKTLEYQQTTPKNFVIEYDVIWPIPGTIRPDDDDDDDDDDDEEDDADNRIFSKRIGRPSRWRLYRRHKRELYSTYEAALDSQGLPGKECLLRTICEARSVLSPPGVSFVDDVLRIILSNFSRSKNEVDEYDLAYESKKDCDVKYSCPFSILELLLSFDQNLVSHA